MRYACRVPLPRAFRAVCVSFRPAWSRGVSLTGVAALMLNRRVWSVRQEQRVACVRACARSNTARNVFVVSSMGVDDACLLSVRMRRAAAHAPTRLAAALPLSRAARGTSRSRRARTSPHAHKKPAGAREIQWQQSIALNSSDARVSAWEVSSSPPSSSCSLFEFEVDSPVGGFARSAAAHCDPPGSDCTTAQDARATRTTTTHRDCPLTGAYFLTSRLALSSSSPRHVGDVRLPVGPRRRR